MARHGNSAGRHRVARSPASSPPTVDDDGPLWRVPWTLADVLFAAWPVLLLSLFAWIAALGTPPPPPETTGPPGTGAVVVGIIVIGIVGFLWAVALFASLWMRIVQPRRLPWSALGVRSARLPAYLLAVSLAVGAYAVVAVADSLNSGVGAITPPQLRRLPTFPADAGGIAVSLLLVFGLVAAFLFALIQLGVGYTWLRSRLPATPAILAYAAAVALLVPPSSPIALVVALLVALAEAWLYERSRSLLVVVAFGGPLLILSLAAPYVLPR